MTANAYQGMQVRNDSPRRRVTCTQPILKTIPPQRLPITTEVQAGVPRWCSITVTNFLSARCLIALDQNGRGKGDLISSSSGPRDWPNQQQETCFSWNNKNTDTAQVYGINSSIPTQHEGSDYINLGAGLPANQIPAQVTAAYPASVNGGSAYDHEYPYPHHLVTGGPSPTPTPTPSPTPTPTATATPTATRPLRPPYAYRYSHSNGDIHADSNRNRNIYSNANSHARYTRLPQRHRPLRQRLLRVVLPQ